MKRKLIVITCPHCGKEYLPTEIFIPNSFFGKPIKILRDNDGKILEIIGTDMDLNESFCCDKCNKTFNINAKITFNTQLNEINFDEDYQRKI